jgi:hypothetical protein
MPASAMGQRMRQAGQARGFANGPADVFQIEALIRNRGMSDAAAPSFFDSIIEKAKQTIDIAGYPVPYWGIAAAAVGAFYFMKKR